MDKLEPIEPIAYFLPEFCKKYCLSRSSFYREIRRKRLHFYKRGKRTMIERTEAERWFSAINPSPPKAEHLPQGIFT